MKKVLEMINYEEFIKIFDHLTVYVNDEDYLVVQEVNNKHIYIEIEQESNNIKYNSVEDMKNVFNKYNIPIKNNDYFVKKAEIEINEREC